MRRRFVAVPVEGHVVAALDAALLPVRAAVPELRWTDPAGWHVTLAFLGEVEDHAVDVAAGVVAAACASVGPVRAALGGVAVLSGQALVVEVADEPAGVLAALGATIQEGLAAADVPVQHRAVRAHVTLARGRLDEISPRLCAGVASAVAVASERVTLRWRAETVDVWCSSGARGGVGYVREASVPVGG